MFTELKQRLFANHEKEIIEKMKKFIADDENQSGKFDGYYEDDYYKETIEEKIENGKEDKDFFFTDFFYDLPEDIQQKYIAEVKNEIEPKYLDYIHKEIDLDDLLNDIKDLCKKLERKLIYSDEDTKNLVMEWLEDIEKEYYIEALIDYSFKHYNINYNNMFYYSHFYPRCSVYDGVQYDNRDKHSYLIFDNDDFYVLTKDKD